MKTIVRGFLFSILLSISLPLMLSLPAVALIGRLAADYSLGQRLTMSGLVALVAIASNEIALALVPASGSQVVWRRILHSLALAGMSVLGFVVLATVDWTVPEEASRLMDLSASRPFITVGGIWFAAYLVVSVIIRPVQSRLARLPRGLRRYLLSGEGLLCSIRQSRLMSPVTPDNLVATDQRLIVHRPSNLGFTSTIEDFNYIDIANIKTERGWMFSTVSIKERFEGNDMTFTFMPRRQAEQLVREVRGEMDRRRQRNVPLPQATGTVAPATQTLQILGRQLASGEITIDQYDERCRRLQGPGGG